MILNFKIKIYQKMGVSRTVHFVNLSGKKVLTFCWPTGCLWLKLKIITHAQSRCNRLWCQPAFDGWVLGAQANQVKNTAYAQLCAELMHWYWCQM